MSLGWEIRVYRSRKIEGQEKPEDELFAYWHLGDFPFRALDDLEKEGRAVSVNARNIWAHFSIVLRASDLVALLWPDGPPRKKPKVISEDNGLFQLGPKSDYIYREQDEFESLQNEPLLIEFTDDDLGYFGPVSEDKPDWSGLLR